MDNSAKALIIAGSFLIGMLVITLSMYLYRSFQDAYTNNMKIHSAIQIDSFNSYFTKYGFPVNGRMHISGADAFNILSRAYDISRGGSDLIFDIDVRGTANLSIDPSNNNYYEKVFYFSKYFENEYEYLLGYNDEGIISSITINNI